jgi:hypothetical protein
LIELKRQRPAGKPPRTTGDADDRIYPSQTAEVMCPRCGAQPGERCVDNGKPRMSASFHIERSRRRGAVIDGDLSELESNEIAAIMAAVGQEPLEVKWNREALGRMQERARGR